MLLIDRPFRRSSSVMARLLSLLLILFAFAAPVTAAEKAPPPAGLTQEQFDSLAKAIGQAVIGQLREEGLVAGKAAGHDVTRQKSVADMGAGAGDEVARFGERAQTVLAAFPAIFSNAARLGTLLDET